MVMENYNNDMNNVEFYYEEPILDNISMESEKVFADGPEKGSGCNASCCYYEDRTSYQNICSFVILFPI